ncbi:MAG: glycosyltransferase family 4 protein [Vulcanimicrobiaceae bacterium]
MTRIALDARMTRRMSVGMRAYATELMARLPRVAPEYAYVPVGSGENFTWDEQVALPLALWRSRASLTHFMSLYVPVLRPVPFVLTIHDLIHLRLPALHRRRVGPYYATVVRHACARAARVITDDAATVEDLERFLGVPPRKVCVISLGVNERFFESCDPRPAPRPYLLYVGNHRPHKNLATLFDAWSSLSERFPVDLYVTGPDDFAGALQARSSDRRRIVALGDLNDEQLRAAYAGARALVHPALCEGFGLPLLEAMAVGTPVVASAESTPGILAQSVLRFPARDARALQITLEDLLADEGLRSRLVNQGKMVARAWSWDRCARATANLYREVLEESR